MNQVEIVSNYIKEKLPNLIQNENNKRLFSFKENGKDKILCIIDEKKDKDSDVDLLFSNGFKLLVSDEELKTNADYFAFCFGDQFFYVESSKINNPKLNILRYLGEYTISNEDFAHLGIHSCYSLLEGCQKIEFYIQKAKYLGMKYLGICEKRTLASVIKFQETCQKEKIKPILGEELPVKIGDYIYNFKFYAKNLNGFKNLTKLSNVVNVFGKQENNEFVFHNDLSDFLEDLIVILPNNFPFDENILEKYNLKDTYYQIDTVEFLDKNVYHNYLQNIQNYIDDWMDIIPPVLLSDSYYLDSEDKDIQKTLEKISNKVEFKYSVRSQHFKSVEEHIEIFSKFWKNNEEKFDEIMGNAISNTIEIAEKCNCEIKFEKLHIPTAIIDGYSYKDNLNFFEKLCRDRMDKLNHTGIDKYEERYKEEYNLIVSAGLENYFLIIWDILNWCKNNNILTGLARGSAAGSYIMFLMDIVKVNPFDYDLLFSRFLNAGRVASIYLDFIFEDENISKKYKHISRLEIPEGGDKIAAKYFEGDILNGHKIKSININYEGHISLPDVDMDISDREKVKEFVINKYGIEQFALLGSYNTFKIKAAIKDLARVMGTNMDYAAINIMTSYMFFKEGVDAFFEEVFKCASDNSMFYDFIQNNKKIINTMYWILDAPKSASVHPCGTLSIPANESIFEDFPLIEQDGEYMCEWTGPELDSLGFVKNDLLGLAQLVFFSDILNLIKQHKNEDIDIYNLPLNDSEVFRYLSNAWNGEVFQMNSNLLRSYCKLLKPTCVEDLSVAVAAVRPGPMNNGLHLKYVKRKNGEEPVTYHFGYENFTRETQGIILFQEEIIQIASYLGDLTLIEGDSLRKSLGKKKMDIILEFHDKIKKKAIEKGCSDKEFEEIWDEWIEFAKYAFNKSHSISYGLTAYISQWLKVHYPQEFWCAAFQKANNSSERKKKFNQYFEELKDSNSPIKVVSPDINMASNKTEFDKYDIFLPLNNIKYLGNEAVNCILEDREKNGEYYSFEEFLVRLGKDKLLNKREFENLVLSGAFDKLENIEFPKDRQKLIKQLYKFLRKDYIRDFITNSFQENELWWSLKQLDLVGVAPINFKILCGKYFQRYKFFDSFEKPEEGQNVNFGGIIIDYKERKTKKGQSFGEVTLENENIPYDLILWHEDWEKYKSDIEKYNGQVVLFEGIYCKNTLSEKWQFNLSKDTTMVFLGETEETKIEKPANIILKKGDRVRLSGGEEGIIVKYPSNYEISVLLDDKTTKIIEKWDVIDVL